MQRLSILSLLLLSTALIHCSTTTDDSTSTTTTGGAAGTAQAGTGGTTTQGGSGGTTTGGTGGTTTQGGSGGAAAGQAGAAGASAGAAAGQAGAAGAGGTTAGSGGSAGTGGTTAAGSGGAAGDAQGGAGAGGSGCGNGLPPAIDCQSEADLGKPCASGGTCLTTNCVGPDGKAVYYCSGDVVDNSAQNFATALGSTDGKCAACLNSMTGTEMTIDCGKAISACDTDPATTDSCGDFISGVDQARAGDPSSTPNCWVESSETQVLSELGNNLAICAAKFCGAACGVTEGYACNN